MFLTMTQGYQEPDQGKEEPREEKGGGKTENGPVPRSSNHWGEEIFQVSDENILINIPIFNYYQL